MCSSDNYSPAVDSAIEELLYVDTTIHRRKSLCPGLNTPLNVTDHLRPLTNVLWDVRPRWYHLGIQLNIDQPTLEVSVFNHPL